MHVSSVTIFIIILQVFHTRHTMADKSDLLDIVNPILLVLNSLPACGEALLLQWVAPVSGLSVMVNVILPPPHGPVQ